MAENTLAQDTVAVVAGFLLAAATVASAWCAYQSTLWNGEQIRAMAKSNQAHFAALEKSTTANAFMLVDVQTLLNYAEDRARGESEAAEYIRKHARPEFRPALNAWISDLRTDPDAPLPFKRPDYQVADAREAKQLDRRAAAAMEVANRANAIGDVYVLHTVLFALSLFFLGSATQAPRRFVRRGMLIFGALAFVLTAISSVRMPRARPEGLRHVRTALPETNP